MSNERKPIRCDEPVPLRALSPGEPERGHYECGGAGYWAPGCGCPADSCPFAPLEMWNDNIVRYGRHVGSAAPIFPPCVTRWTP